MRAGAAPDDSVSHGFAEAIELLGPLGHNVVDGRLPFDGPDSIRVLNDITEGMFTRRLGAMCDLIGVQIAPEDLEHRSVTLIDAGNRIDDARFGAAWQQVETIVAAYLERLGEIDIWMTPTFSSEIVRIGVFGPDVAWDDQKEHLVDYAGYCWIDNFAGTPSISLDRKSKRLNSSH